MYVVLCTYVRKNAGLFIAHIAHLSVNRQRCFAQARCSPSLLLDHDIKMSSFLHCYVCRTKNEEYFFQISQVSKRMPFQYCPKNFEKVKSSQILLFFFVIMLTTQEYVTQVHLKPLNNSKMLSHFEHYVVNLDTAVLRIISFIQWKSVFVFLYFNFEKDYTSFLKVHCTRFFFCFVFSPVERSVAFRHSNGP